jgi:REP element-mobilizing transposase RayT
MARPLRFEFSGALYHITARGNGRCSIFLGEVDKDRAAFLDVLAGTCKRFNWICHAYCLMSDHYHLLVETPDANLSKGMRQLNGIYIQLVNRTHGRVGHLFQGRFKAILVERESYLLELARYVLLNPVRAGMVRPPGEWPWSSCLATAGETPAPKFVATDWLLRAFAETRDDSVVRYRRFVAEGIGAAGPWMELKGHQISLGSEPFVSRMQALIDPKRPLQEIPKRQRRAQPKPLDEYVSRYPDRDRALAEAYRTGAYSMQILAEHFGISRMTASRPVRNNERTSIGPDATCSGSMGLGSPIDLDNGE